MVCGVLFARDEWMLPVNKRRLSTAMVKSYSTLWLNERLMFLRRRSVRSHLLSKLILIVFNVSIFHLQFSKQPSLSLCAWGTWPAETAVTMQTPPFTESAVGGKYSSGPPATILDSSRPISRSGPWTNSHLWLYLPYFLLWPVCLHTLSCVQACMIPIV